MNNENFYALSIKEALGTPPEIYLPQVGVPSCSSKHRICDEADFFDYRMERSSCQVPINQSLPTQRVSESQRRDASCDRLVGAISRRCVSQPQRFDVVTLENHLIYEMSGAKRENI